MKKIIGIITISFFFVQVSAQSFYNLPTKDVAGRSVNIRNYKGKKLLVVIVPVDATDSLVDQIAAFKARYDDSIEVIGLVIAENNADYKVKEMAMHNKLKNRNVLLVKGQNKQVPSPLMKWLSNHGNTHSFIRDVTVPGCKIFISGTGRVLNVLSPQTKLDDPFINWIVNSNPSVR